MRTPRRFALTGLVAAAVAIAPAAAGASATTTQPGGPELHACQTHQLVTYLSDGNGAAGSTYYDLNFVNLGSTACTLSGYPGVSAVSLTGKQIGKAAKHGSGSAKTITLKAAGAGTFSAAYAQLNIVDAQNFPTAKCGLTNAAGLRIYPPNQKAADAVPLPFAACSSTSDSVLGIGPVKSSGR